MTITNENVSLEIFDQLNVEIEKLVEVIQQVIIKKRKGEHLTEKIEEFDERHKNTEDMLRRLKQSVREKAKKKNSRNSRRGMESRKVCEDGFVESFRGTN
ncbi:hypothetical protein FEM48_Zijuj10G0019100 [Ziziphus jujuba var. spinosa]|uniref:Uncharacterized protein n=1 Tax=Ziziphus jujuba var. spinosa TaxID=714518 RepID=A0A978UKL6_ZIZJJ|nr:hypothetical protein FEM48_Zijuj10G0019100 [Ziziphus jujuba var. spinosa]